MKLYYHAAFHLTAAVMVYQYFCWSKGKLVTPRFPPRTEANTFFPLAFLLFWETVYQKYTHHK